MVKSDSKNRMTLDQSLALAMELKRITDDIKSKKWNKFKNIGELLTFLKTQLQFEITISNLNRILNSGSIKCDLRNILEMVPGGGRHNPYHFLKEKIDEELNRCAFLENAMSELNNQIKTLQQRVEELENRIRLVPMA